MKPKFLSIFICLLLVSSLTFAQDEMFKVLASKGTTKVVSPGSSEQKPVLVGKKLFKDDKIIVGEGSYLGLAHKSGKTIELKKAGTYEVGKLASEVAAQNATVSKKYVDFVAGEIASKDEDMAKNRYKYMQVTGSVTRATPTPGANPITVLTPKEVYTLSSPVMLKWMPVSEATSYVVTLTNLGEEPVFSVETNETSVLVDLEKLNFKTEKNLLWKVVAKGNDKTESEACILKYVDEEKAPNLEKAVADMKSELSEETALNKIVLASFYEENGLLLDALANYEAAIKLEPEVEDFKVAYGQFLQRNNLAQAK
ncbi:MAG: hypothetical protein K2X86_04615 [Cytophagaceae bacterium]|nr:hypothetical protein [Cytophagaceae bacterium]